jgi:hypothetical protein
MARNVMMNPQVADAWPVFRVDNPDLITLLEIAGEQPRAAAGRQALFMEPNRAVVRRASTRKTSASRKSNPASAAPTNTPSARSSSG